MQAFDQKTVDAALSYFQAELTHMEPNAIKPLVQFNYFEHIETVPLDGSDTQYAFDEVNYSGVDKSVSWIADTQTEFGVVGAQYNRKFSNARPIGQLIRKGVKELERAERLGRNLEGDLMSALNAKIQQDLNTIAYFGDTKVASTGMLNNTGVTVSAGAIAGTDWVAATADVVIKAVMDLVLEVRSATLVMPDTILLPFNRYYLLTQKFTNASGNETALDFLLNRSVFATQNGGRVQIMPCENLTAAGAAGKDRAVVYRAGRDTLCLPLSPLSNTPIVQKHLHLETLWHMNVADVVVKRPELIRYKDFA